MFVPVGAGAVLGYLVAKKGQLALVPVEHPLASITKELKDKQLVYYTQPPTISLAVARLGRNPEAFNIVGDFLSVETITGIADIAFNEPNNPYVSLNNLREFRTPFYRFFLRHAAQAGLTVRLNIGRDASFLTKPLTPVKIANSAGAEINPAVNERLVPQEVANQHAVAEVGGVDILAADITPETPNLLRTMVMLSVAGIFSTILENGGVRLTLQFNGGVALTVGCAYIFDILVGTGDTVNFQTSVAGDVTLRTQVITGGVQ